MKKQLRAISVVLFYGLYVVKVTRSGCWALRSRNALVLPAVSSRLQVSFGGGGGCKLQVIEGRYWRRYAVRFVRNNCYNFYHLTLVYLTDPQTE
jgi:hypothetical protein